MAQFVYDSFTDAPGTEIGAHTSETGATWVKLPGVTASARIGADGGSMEAQSVGASHTYYASGDPAGPDYSVSLLFERAGTQSGSTSMGVCGRMSTSAVTFYYARHLANALSLWKLVGGGATQLGANVSELDPAGKTLTLRMQGTTIELLLDGVPKISVSDNAITAAGKVGFRGYLVSGHTTYRAAAFWAGDMAVAADSVSPSDASHGAAAENVPLLQLHRLSPSSGHHGHLADADALSSNALLVVAGARHADAAGTVAVLQPPFLVVESAHHRFRPDMSAAPPSYRGAVPLDARSLVPRGAARLAPVACSITEIARK